MNQLCNVLSRLVLTLAWSVISGALGNCGSKSLTHKLSLGLISRLHENSEFSLLVVREIWLDLSCHHSYSVRYSSRTFAANSSVLIAVLHLHRIRDVLNCHSVLHLLNQVRLFLHKTLRSRLICTNSRLVSPDSGFPLFLVTFGN